MLTTQCRVYLARLKWPEGFRCAHCGGDAAYFLPSKRVVYECIGCRRQVSVITGTIFEQSKKPLGLWSLVHPRPQEKARLAVAT